MHVIGGFRADPNYPTAERTGWPTSHEHWRSLDGVTWEQLADLPFDRAGVVDAVEIEGQLVIVGGVSSPAPITTYPTSVENDVWAWDGLRWRQTAKAASWSAKRWIGAAAFDRKLWVFGGYSGSTNLGGARYSEDLGDSWTEVSAPWHPSHADGVCVAEKGVALASGNQQGVDTFFLKSDKVLPAAFDPSMLPLTGWWRDFRGVPWAGDDSFGPSADDSTEIFETTNPPSQAQDLNNNGVTSFDGTDDRLTGPLASALFGEQFSIWWLFYADSAPTDPGDAAPYDAPGMSDASGAPIALGITASGVRAGYYDGATWSSVLQAAPVGAWHLARVRSDGTKIELSVDSQPFTSVSRAAPYVPSGNAFRVGVSYGFGHFFAGKIAEIGTAATDFSDEIMEQIKIYANTRYGLFL
jgi:hypothetical protein